LILKQPAVRLTPLAKVDDAVDEVRLRMVPLRAPVNVVVDGEPKVAAPESPSNERALTDDVALAVEVARKKKLPTERIVQRFAVAVPPLSAICGAVDEAIVSMNAGLVVPTPKFPFLNPMNATGVRLISRLALPVNSLNSDVKLTTPP
jgi:hypothetical protein